MIRSLPLRLSCCLFVAVLFAACAQQSTTTEDADVQQPNTIIDPDRYNVAFLIMDGVYNTELTAPLDIFHHTRYRENIRPMNVFTVAQSPEPVATFEGLVIQPDFTFTGRGSARHRHPGGTER